MDCMSFYYKNMDETVDLPFIEMSFHDNYHLYYAVIFNCNTKRRGVL